MAVTDFIIFFGWIAALGGATLLALGWFMPRHGYDGHCRKCEYNVSRTPRDNFRCPECGTDLETPKAIVLGRRRIAPGYIKLGFVAFAVGAPIVFTVLLLWVTGSNIDSFKPLWVLHAEAVSGDAETEMSAIVEFQRRINAKQLSPVELTDLATRALIVGSNRPKRIEAAWQRIYLSSATKDVREKILRNFLTTSLRPIVEFHSPIRPGEPLAFRVRYNLDSVPFDPSITLQESSISIRIADKELQAPIKGNVFGRAVPALSLNQLRDEKSMTSLERSLYVDDAELLRALAFGEQKIRGELTISVEPGGGAESMELKLPWESSVEVADASAPGLRSYSAWELWSGSFARIKSTSGVLIGSAVGTKRPSLTRPGRIIVLSRPDVEQVIPVRVKLRGMLREVDCGLVLLDGTENGRSVESSVLISAEHESILDEPEVRVIIAPADDVALRCIGVTATLAAARAVPLTVETPATQPAD